MIVPDVNMLVYAYDSSLNQHVGDVFALLRKAGTAGNLATDAQIAVLARQERAVLHSNDTDFLRFPGMRWYNPLTGKEQRT